MEGRSVKHTLVEVSAVVGVGEDALFGADEFSSPLVDDDAPTHEGD